LLRDIFEEVRAATKARQTPFLNLTTSSFALSLPETGSHFPSLWAARARLVKPPQAYKLSIPGASHSYFVRLGSVEPSPFIPEDMKAHSFSVGKVLLRAVQNTSEGVTLDGTLRADEFLTSEPNDLLWLRLPLERPLDFYAQMEKPAANLKEARFRSFPVRLTEKQFAELTATQGRQFPKSPYELWPLLSSPYDLYSLGVISVRLLVAGSGQNLPAVLDEAISLASRLAPPPEEAESPRVLGPEEQAHEDRERTDARVAALRKILASEPSISERFSPSALVANASGKPFPIHEQIWLEALDFALRLFPGQTAHSYCKHYGDVSARALETAFDRPRADLEALVFRLRETLTPTLTDNLEIASVVMDLLDKS
jgi:hypothetical protein